MNNLAQFNVVALYVTDLKKAQGGIAFGGMVLFASCLAFTYVAATCYALSQSYIRTLVDEQNTTGKEQSELVGSLTILNF